MEGLDCVGKSSSGSLITYALEKAGYEMEHAQYNKPPTLKEQTHPWMWHFETPSTTAPSTSIVWDRGPAGDFVYGKLSDLSHKERQGYYASIQAFEEKCSSESFLFLKILFIANRDLCIDFHHHI
jgi:polyphosphate kinase 2 (PPK2 family)